jgi:DNA-binding MarR family transcriptional regulator
VNPELFQHLDRVIHEKGRLAIMALLAGSPAISFIELRDALGMTDGNLTTHLHTLQEVEYVALTKSKKERRPTTICTLTSKGRDAFAAHVELLGRIVEAARRNSSAGA